MLQSKVFQIATEIEWQDLGDGIKRQVFGYDDRIMMVKVKFEQGAVGVLHQHPHIQVSYVESGVFEASIADQKKIGRWLLRYTICDPWRSLYGSRDFSRRIQSSQGRLFINALSCSIIPGARSVQTG
jgi:hypothetical protein